MRLLVISHKVCWSSERSPSGYATDGGFPFQMQALSELFDSTTLALPCRRSAEGGSGERVLTGRGLRVAPLTAPRGRGAMRKLLMVVWVIRNAPSLVSELRRADAVHAPIPGDVGTVGMLLAWILRKRLFVRYCGDWRRRKTLAEKLWARFMHSQAGGRNVMMATGIEPATGFTNGLSWTFASSLWASDLAGLAAVERRAPKRGDLVLNITCRQEPSKGTDIVICALPLVAERWPGVVLDVVGDGSALPNLRALAARCGVSDRVRFHGPLPHGEVLGRFCEADVFCFPTLSSEGFPKVVVEALATGTPVVSTGVSAIPGIIEGAGSVLEEATPEATASAILDCVADPERYLAMGKQAVETARSYSLERWGEEIGSILAESWGSLRDHG